MKPSSHSHSQSSLFSLSLTFANQAGKKSKSPRDRFWQNEDVDPNHTSFIQHDLPLPLLDKRHSEQLPPDSLPHPRSPSLPFRTIRRLRSSSQHPRPTGRPHNRLRPSFPLPSPPPPPRPLSSLVALVRILMLLPHAMWSGSYIPSGRQDPVLAIRPRPHRRLCLHRRKGQGRVHPAGQDARWEEEEE
jgi:hypothetical protein